MTLRPIAAALGDRQVESSGGMGVPPVGTGGTPVPPRVAFLLPPALLLGGALVLAADTAPVVFREYLVRDGYAYGLVAADLDGDGDLDVVATAWGQPGGVVWFENAGDPRGRWPRHVLKDRWINANQVILADLDRDGRLDVAATAERGANELRWWRNEGRGQK